MESCSSLREKRVQSPCARREHGCLEKQVRLEASMAEGLGQGEDSTGGVGHEAKGRFVGGVGSQRASRSTSVAVHVLFS